MEEEVRVIDGVTYLVKKCPGCGKELLFKKRNEARRVHCACANCGKEMEVYVDKL